MAFPVRSLHILASAFRKLIFVTEYVVGGLYMYIYIYIYIALAATPFKLFALSNGAKPANRSQNLTTTFRARRWRKAKATTEATPAAGATVRTAATTTVRAARRQHQEKEQHQQNYCHHKQ